MTATVCVLLTSCFFLLTFSTTLITSQTWNLPFGSSSSLRTMFRNPNMLSSSLGDPPSRGQMVIPVTRGVVGVRNQLSPMQQEIRQRQQQLAQLQQQNTQQSLR
ncbi:hypothetical protein C0Q70_08240 [Pomacea canaliculata]|uniref:Corticotropin-releasing factor domain-containing protein n=2 Tax=Pomacea canaliculata TaxID=400727 RepID=A0A2T7PH99_POMCA|nr:hypothetical protein C0Q70_08240 [Pomacea canaliculata]